LTAGSWSDLSREADHSAENREQEDMSQSILIETVRVVRDFLNAELSKYKSFEDLPDLLMNLLEGETPKAKHNAFEKVSRGVGQTTILKFLGGGWKQWKIQ
jgi:hypothetical protein